MHSWCVYYSFSMSTLNLNPCMLSSNTYIAMLLIHIPIYIPIHLLVIVERASNKWYIWWAVKPTSWFTHGSSRLMISSHYTYSYGIHISGHAGVSIVFQLIKRIKFRGRLTSYRFYVESSSFRERKGERERDNSINILSSDICLLYTSPSPRD